MKRLLIAIPLLLACLYPAKADNTQMSAVSESIKAARARTLDVGQVAGVRTIAKALLDEKTRRATADQRNDLGAELANLREQLTTQRMVHLQELAKQLDAEDSGQPVITRLANARPAIPQGALTRLHNKRLALQTAAATHPELAEAIGKVDELEAELSEISELPVEERASRLDELSARLTPHRASDFASNAMLQPTLTLGRQPQSAE